MTTIRSLVAAAAAFFIWPALGWSHPHQWVDVVETVVLDDDGLAGVRQEWRLLRAYNIDIMRSYDWDHDGAFDEAEQEALYDSALMPFVLFNSFFRLSWNGGEYMTNAVSDFSARIVDDEVVFEFFVPIGLELGDEPAVVELLVYDSSIYTSYDLFNCFVEGPDGVSCSMEFVPVPDTISHGLDGLATRLALTIARTGTGSRAAAAAPALAPNIVPRDGNELAAPSNPFFGAP